MTRDGTWPSEAACGFAPRGHAANHLLPSAGIQLSLRSLLIWGACCAVVFALVARLEAESPFRTAVAAFFCAVVGYLVLAVPALVRGHAARARAKKHRRRLIPGRWPVARSPLHWLPRLTCVIACVYFLHLPRLLLYFVLPADLSAFREFWSLENPLGVSGRAIHLTVTAAALAFVVVDLVDLLLSARPERRRVWAAHAVAMVLLVLWPLTMPPRKTADELAADRATVHLTLLDSERVEWAEESHFAARLLIPRRELVERLRTRQREVDASRVGPRPLGIKLSAGPRATVSEVVALIHELRREGLDRIVTGWFNPWEEPRFLRVVDTPPGPPPRLSESSSRINDSGTHWLVISRRPGWSPYSLQLDGAEVEDRLLDWHAMQYRVIWPRPPNGELDDLVAWCEEDADFWFVQRVCFEVAGEWNGRYTPWVRRIIISPRRDDEEVPDFSDAIYLEPVSSSDDPWSETTGSTPIE